MAKMSQEKIDSIKDRAKRANTGDPRGPISAQTVRQNVFQLLAGKRRPDEDQA